MALQPSIIKVGTTLTIHMSGKIYTIDQTVKNYAAITEAIKAKAWGVLKEELDIATLVATRSKGKAEVSMGRVLLGGVEVRTVVADRIIAMLKDGWDVDPMLKFVENVDLNPEGYAKEELYLFLETNNLPITDDGCFLAYKVVGADYYDKYSHTLRNQIGDKPEMKRSEVDKNRNNTCSRGLHFCSLEYIKHFSSGGTDRLMIVKVNPADVVSIPSDYQNTKGRCWIYEVVDEIPMIGRHDFDRTAPAVVKTDEIKNDHRYEGNAQRVIDAINACVSPDGEIDLGTWLQDLDMEADVLADLRETIQEDFNLNAVSLPEDAWDAWWEKIHDKTTVLDLVRWIEKILLGLKDEAVAPEERIKTNLAPVAKPEKAQARPNPMSGAEIKTIREEAGISGKALADKLGVSRSAVWSVENSLFPKPETVEKYLAAIESLKK